LVLLVVDFREAHFTIKQLPNPKKYCWQAPLPLTNYTFALFCKERFKAPQIGDLSMKMLITLDNFIIKLLNMDVFKTFRDINLPRRIIQKRGYR
jgi:hypothetical protein